MSCVKYDDLYRTLTEALEQLRERDPDHELLGLLIIEDRKITCTQEFETLYPDFRYDAITQYVTDVFNAVKE